MAEGPVVSVRNLTKIYQQGEIAGIARDPERAGRRLCHQRIEAGQQHERALALACGFAFKVGVRSAAHKAALLALDITLDIVVMDWC